MVNLQKVCASLLMTETTHHTQAQVCVYCVCHVCAGLCGFQVSSLGRVKEGHGSAGSADGDGCSGTSPSSL